MLKRLIVVAVMIIAPVLTQARVETWVDDQGVTHHSNVRVKPKASKSEASSKTAPALSTATGTGEATSNSAVTAAAPVDTPAKSILPTTAMPTLPGGAPLLRSAIGTNLNPVEYYTTQLPFVDIMKSGSAWGASDGLPLDLDANGWVRSLRPGQIAHMLTMNNTAGTYPAGQYIVRYKGEGTLKIFLDARIVSQQPGEMVLQVTPTATGDGIWIQIEATNPGNYLRDIQITMPGGVCAGDMFRQVAAAQDCNGTQFLSFADNASTIIFNPVFLDRLRTYSALR